MIGIKANLLSPKKIAELYRAAIFCLLYVWWTMHDQHLTGMILLLLECILILVRWRFPKAKWSVLVDCFIVITTILFWPNAFADLVLAVFELAYWVHPVLAVFSMFAAYWLEIPLVFLLLMSQSTIIGLILQGWQSQQQTDHKQIDESRRRYYECKSMIQELLTAHHQVSRLAELTERNRIARDLHDHASHALTAAYLSLQTAINVSNHDEVLMQELLQESLQRLEKGIHEIRDTVHNLAPVTALGIERLQLFCREFSFCPISFHIYGDTTKVPAYIWSVLEPCLKEALTNVVRHSQASLVEVQLDVTSHIVRLSVSNDGISSATSVGRGLYNLRQRAKAAGGSLSVSHDTSFRLVCVLPIG